MSKTLVFKLRLKVPNELKKIIKREKRERREGKKRRMTCEYL